MLTNPLAGYEWAAWLADDVFRALANIDKRLFPSACRCRATPTLKKFRTPIETMTSFPATAKTDVRRDGLAMNHATVLSGLVYRTHTQKNLQKCKIRSRRKQ